MKKALLAALLVMVISSWCLAQSDSLPAPTAEPCQSAPCAEPCQPANCNSPCQSGPCATPCCPAAVAEPFVPKWAVGASIQQLTDIPGTFFIERLCNKNILQIFIAADYNGSIEPDGEYYDGKTNDLYISLGATGLKEMKDCGRYLRLYFGLSPELFYDRYARTYYDYRDSTYYDRYSTYYGAKLRAFIKASFVKEMNLKGAIFQNELSVIPISLYSRIRYDRDYDEYSWGDHESSFYKIYYGVNLITAGSITYSIKYLF